MFPLQIQPIIQLQYQCPILFSPDIHGIVVGVDNEQIRHRLEAPLQAAVDVEVVALGVVLQESCPEDVAGEIDFDLGADQEEVFAAKGIGKFEFVIDEIQGKNCPRAGPDRSN